MSTGRFAPSPTGPLHAGSLATALASWLDARAHAGRWLVRIEDVDRGRCRPGMGGHILHQLARCGLIPDAEPVWQSRRGAAYGEALQRLVAAGLAYPCACSRKAIVAALTRAGQAPQRGEELHYPGTCRPERGGLRGRPESCRILDIASVLEEQRGQSRPRRVRSSPASRPAISRPGSLLGRTWRFHSARFERCFLAAASGKPAAPIRWADRRLGPAAQYLERAVGDFTLMRADGCWAYQLAVVVDDAAQGITDVVRGADLADNTPRQIALQRALGLATPRYLHLPLMRGADGQKLSKQNGARAVDLAQPVRALAAAAAFLGLVAPAAAPHPAALLAALVPLWRARHG